MSHSMPFPIRVAAGLVSTGLDTLRRFPEDLPTIGVEIAGAVTKASLQVRQQFVELALRGDELLKSGGEPEEHPSWAHFDDEEPDLSAPVGSPPPDSSPASSPKSRNDATSTGDAGDDAPDPRADGDALLPGYDSMTLAQVRGHLRHLDVDQVRRLLEHEKAGGNRPAMLTLLGNRVITLQQAR